MGHRHVNSTEFLVPVKNIFYKHISKECFKVLINNQIQFCMNKFDYKYELK